MRRAPSDVGAAQRGADEVERLADAQLDPQLVVHVERARAARRA